MSAAVAPAPVPTPAAPPPLDPADIWRVPVERYEQMVASGALTKLDRVELLEGILVAKMPKSPEHVLGTQLTSDTLRALLPSGWLVRTEAPIRLDDSEPEPDVAVARGPARSYATRHPVPDEITVVIEVADSSLRRDRELKRRIYARNAVAVYWIVNVADREVTVYTDPSGPAPAPDYANSATYRPGDAAPVVIAGAAAGTVPVADLLP